MAVAQCPPGSWHTCMNSCARCLRCGTQMATHECVHHSIRSSGAVSTWFMAHMYELLRAVPQVRHTNGYAQVCAAWSYAACQPIHLGAIFAWWSAPLFYFSLPFSTFYSPFLLPFFTLLCYFIILFAPFSACEACVNILVLFPSCSIYLVTCILTKDVNYNPFQPS